ncbi:hypothetical protein [Parvibium lacunae]|uniref:Uncharacterized protein n=1 Tax=Parvibium lacunae TaxID=1888893 RepID=A0A368L8L9_9BURK|nr:hypothetical protein [Parvibium lacunae]RCS59861.1 hypothetical protein DU000_03980 [Parvibium lacunae]
MTQLLENIARVILSEQNRVDHALCGSAADMHGQTDRLALAQSAQVRQAKVALATIPQTA